MSCKWKFMDAPLAELLRTIFDTINGHKHDGVDSPIIADDTVSLAKLKAESRTQVIHVPIENLAAAGDIAARAVAYVPAGLKYTLVSAVFCLRVLLRV